MELKLLVLQQQKIDLEALKVSLGMLVQMKVAKIEIREKFN